MHSAECVTIRDLVLTAGVPTVVHAYVVQVSCWMLTNCMLDADKLYAVRQVDCDGPGSQWQWPARGPPCYKRLECPSFRA